MIGLIARTDAGVDWLANNVTAEPWQNLGAVTWIDVRCAVEVIRGALTDGLTVFDEARGFAKL